MTFNEYKCGLSRTGWVIWITVVIAYGALITILLNRS